MGAVIPWARLIALINPHYPKAGQGLLRDFASNPRQVFVSVFLPLSSILESLGLIGQKW
ncbi:MAG: hypothetical protein IVW54_15825 [Candidatus Binataceae bacterium]|nr:hypothetical protein [Candidatus Binataceae bacterium]